MDHHLCALDSIETYRCKIRLFIHVWREVTYLDKGIILIHVGKVTPGRGGGEGVVG